MSGGAVCGGCLINRGGIMDNLCVCCGAIIPEGRMVCPICEMKADDSGTFTAAEVT